MATSTPFEVVLGASPEDLARKVGTTDELHLFISYRREDSEHAAQRLYLRLVQKFGDSAVFIDRKLSPSDDWRERIEREIDRCTGFVLIIGNRFVDRLQGRAPDLTDELVFEIGRALQQGKRIFPVVAGPPDMPPEDKLPAEIRPIRRANAVFAPAQYFDTAMDGLIDGIVAAHNWVDPRPAAAPQASTPATELVHLVKLLCALAVALGTVGALGRGVLWLAHGGALAGSWPAEEVYWHGWRYVLATLIGGMGPYLAYWLVAELRTRARLPFSFHNLPGLLAAVNMAGVLCAGGAFLLLSTLPGWSLVPFLFDARFEGAAGSYVLLAIVLLAIVLGSVSLALYEVRARRIEGKWRSLRFGAINFWGGVQLAAVAWFFASLAASLAWPPRGDVVPVIGYLMLCPVLSLLMLAWQLAQSYLGMSQRSWPFRAMLGLLIVLYVMCTMALYAHGLWPVLEYNARP